MQKVSKPRRYAILRTPGIGDTCLHGSYEQHGFPRKDLHSGSAYLFP
jgi:hypothetical protein